MHQSGIDGNKVLFAIGNSAIVLAPSRFGCVAVKMRPGDILRRVPTSARRKREKNDLAALVQVPSSL